MYVFQWGILMKCLFCLSNTTVCVGLTWMVKWSCVCVCVSVCLSVCLCVSLSVCMCVWAYMCTCTCMLQPKICLRCDMSHSFLGIKTPSWKTNPSTDKHFKLLYRLVHKIPFILSTKINYYFKTNKSFANKLICFLTPLWGNFINSRIMTISCDDSWIWF